MPNSAASCAATLRFKTSNCSYRENTFWIRGSVASAADRDWLRSLAAQCHIRWNEEVEVGVKGVMTTADSRGDRGAGRARLRHKSRTPNRGRSGSSSHLRCLFGDGEALTKVFGKDQVS